MTYFKNCKTIEEVKQLFKELAKANHPDRGGSTEVMQVINCEYAQAIKLVARGANLSETEVEDIIFQSEAYAEAIQAVINLEGVIIEVVGSWIWATGNTYSHRATFKGAGFYFASKKCAWYFRTDDNKVNNRKKLTLDQIRNKYGSKVLTANSYQARYLRAS